MLKQLIYKREFERIFKENYTRLYMYALHLIGDAEVSRDLVSEIFANIWENIDLLNRDTINSYLMKSIRYRSIDYLRHQIIQRQYTEDYITNVTEFYSDYSEKKEEDQLVEQMLQQLPPMTRLILEECYLHQKKYAEVAEELGISPNTVKKHITKALKLLRMNFNGEINKRTIPESET